MIKNRSITKGTPQQFAEVLKRKIVDITNEDDIIGAATNTANIGVAPAVIDDEDIISSQSSNSSTYDEIADSIADEFMNDSQGFPVTQVRSNMLNIKVYSDPGKQNCIYNKMIDLSEYDDQIAEFGADYLSARLYEQALLEIDEGSTADDINAASSIVDMGDPTAAERYIHNLIGDLESAYDENIVGAAYDQTDVELIVTVTTSDTQVLEFTVPFEDLTFDFDRIDEDVEYIIDAIHNELSGSLDVSYRVYELDEDNDEIECIYTDSDESNAIAYAEDYSKSNGCETHVVMFDKSSEHTEVVWTSYSETDSNIDASTHSGSIVESGTFDDYIDDDDEICSDYEFVESKQVPDSNGFLTDYTWYKCADGTHVFVFGDNDIYKPEDGYFDWECDSEDEAREWFENYEGFSDDEDFDYNFDDDESGDDPLRHHMMRP